MPTAQVEAGRAILTVWSTPPRSDLFDSPFRSRLSVVSLFPKASRNTKGKLGPVEWALGQRGDSLLNLDGIHDSCCAL